MKKYPFTVGSDPEAFFRQNGRIIGSEKVIPELGIKQPFSPDPALIVRDGVQIEFHPLAASTYPDLARNIGLCFKSLKKHLTDHPNVELSFDMLVEVEQAEIDSLEEKNRELGCLPSDNIYGTFPIKVNGKTYLKRSAGGHMHFGVRQTPIWDVYGYVNQMGTDERVRLVAMLELFCGNTAVLIDRDKGQVERRKNYGRAGEHRLNAHGLEYRTLSNFWLRSPVLGRLMFGMAHFAVDVLSNTINGNGDYENELAGLIDLREFRKAINRNDYKLARKNFDAIRPFIVKYADKSYPIHAGNIDKFLTFTEGVKKLGIEAYFPTDKIVDSWIDPKDVSFTNFLEKL